MKENRIQQDHDAIISVPLYAKMLGISVSEVEYQFLKIKFKPQYRTYEFTNHLKEEFNNLIHLMTNRVPSEDRTYKNWLYYSGFIFDKHNYERESRQFD